MNKKGQLQNILLMFMGIIVAITLISPIFNTQNQLTDKQTVVDEAIDISAARIANGDINDSYEFTVAQAPTGWKQTDCPLSTVTYGNSTDDYTVTTDYVINLTTGVLKVQNTTTTINGGNDTLIDYTYCADGYNTDSGSRGTAKLIGLFSVLGLLGFLVYFLKFKY